jgi:UDP-N-acetylmuramoylalanine-D-glutamate ligase
MGTFKKETVLVAIADQKTTCGILYVKKGSIVKCAANQKPHSDTVVIYRNKDAERDDQTHYVSADKLRLAEPHEVEAWANCIYFINDIKVRENESVN